MGSVTSESISYESTDRLFILGQPVHLLRDYSRWLTSRMQNRLGTHVVTLNAEMTMQANQHPPLAAALHQADLVIPDGAGVVLYLRLYGHKVRRYAGIELAEHMIRQTAHLNDHSVFFYGGKPDILDKATVAWQQRLPKLRIAGAFHGYLSDTEEQQLLAKLQETQPSLVLVGLGVPRQELWIATHRHLCPQAIWIGVGGSFDIWSGSKERAPAWLANHHLEWLYRLYQEPWRWKRMSALPKFALLSIVQRLKSPRP